ncbi:chromate efflux transporter [Thalassomonas viridans]|uniref:Chromate efflux transporter n=1 Tax=Thalassomonas viridans TaxID=137584 RepID=A0AAE9Z6R1_9GAMM|nr:chromate efflux transporter [Thalassomonas viridans]WDE07134.1 chromate efflux transporter [Thalassomonas viridans]
MFDVFRQFFLLGLFSFGGPAAHIGYFHKAFVVKRKWLAEEEFANLVAISHLLPGPGSSQVGFAIGYHRRGLGGALCAFVGFTLPSVLLMMGFAYFSRVFEHHFVVDKVIHGLKLLAVIVVADAVFGMFKSFCRCCLTQTLCVLTAIALLLFQSMAAQIVAIVLAGMVGHFRLRPGHSSGAGTGLSVNYPLLLVFTLLFAVSFFTFDNVLLDMFAGFFQAGSLVFGGGHVVMPLLQSLTAGSISTETFLTGYAAAQGIPGPMFTFATFLGFHSDPQAPVTAAIAATLAVFLPGFLLLLSVKSAWVSVKENNVLRGVISGINAAVVGLLMVALYQPIFLSAVFNATDLAIVLGGILLLKSFNLSIVKLIVLVLAVNVCPLLWV